MARKNVTLQKMIGGVLYDLMVQTGADVVIVNSETNETLADRLAQIALDIESAVAGGLTATQAQEIAAEEVAKIVGEAPEAGNTLKELFDLIGENEDAITAINNAITNKVDKEEGKGLSAEDFTTALKTKLEGIAEGATKTEESSTNGNIKINGTEVEVYKHPSTDGNIHLPSGGTVGQVLRAGGSGAGVWGDNVRSGEEAPADLAEGELFIKIVG